MEPRRPGLPWKEPSFQHSHPNRRPRLLRPKRRRLPRPLRPRQLSLPLTEGSIAAVLQAGGAPPGATMVFSTVAASEAWMVAKAGPEPGRIFEFQGDRVTIGSGPQDGISINDPSVGSPHALLRISDHRYQLYDQPDGDGTLVNGEPTPSALLEDGTRISMGGSELFFTLVGGAAEGTGQGPSGVMLVRSGPATGKSFQVGDQDLVIGRNPGDGGAQLDDSTISGRHAIVRSEPGGLRIYDLGSANGTTVNDVIVAGTLLQSGDVVKVGAAELQFVLEQPA